ncbi:unnamed protein product [Hanseniaspora opuntiae]
MEKNYSDDPSSSFNYDPIQYSKKKSTARKVCLNIAKVFVVLLVSLVLLYRYNIKLINSLVWKPLSVPDDVDLTVTRFLNVLTTSNEAKARSRELTFNPHLAGHDMADVDSSAIPYIISKFEEYGLNVYNESYNVSLNTPIKTSLQLFGKKTPYSNSSMYGDSTTSLIYEASLFEDELPEDPYPETPIYKGGWHGFSKNGTVEAPYVFVNYGTLEDFNLLKKMNVSTKGHVCIAKYGKIYRGLKVKFGQEVGECSAVVLYSDPGDDYYKVKDGYKAYPEGPARNPSSLQRGSVLFLSDLQENVTDIENIIPKIPSVPCSYASIKPILETLNGHGLTCDKMNTLSKDKDWCNGAIEGLTYSTGPAPAELELTLKVENIQDYGIKTIYNVMGNLSIGVGQPKTERGYILIGAHRDTWSAGGADPESGTTAILEILRALKFLQDTYAWLPKTNIVFASWDAEEYGLIGSSVYASTHAKDLMSNALAYLNVDVACSGSALKVHSSPLLNEIIKKSLSRVSYPKDPSLNLNEHFFGSNERIGSLGSGSDYTGFLEHVGIPSLDIGFAAGPEDPAYHYHSNFDSYYWMSTFQDPDYEYHNAISQALGAMLLELSENELVQFKTYEYLELIDGFFYDIADEVPEEWYGFVPVHKPKKGKGHSKDHGKDCHEKDKKHDHDEKTEEKKAAEKDMKKENEDAKELKHDKKKEGCGMEKAEKADKKDMKKEEKADKKEMKNENKKDMKQEKKAAKEEMKHDKKKEGCGMEKAEKADKKDMKKEEKADKKEMKNENKKDMKQEKKAAKEEMEHDKKEKGCGMKGKKPHKGKHPKAPKPLIDLMNDVYDKILVRKDKALKIDAESDSLNLDLKNIDWLPYWDQIAIKYRILGQNMKLKYFERKFLDKEGLKGRPFFKHSIYAAGHNYGYASNELPGLRDALDELDVEEFYLWLVKLDHIFD